VIDVLDANHDGVISADEIAYASEALKQLDKNGDGQLTRDEMRPPPPPRNGGQGRNNSSQSQVSGQQDN
jgi:Ca2+-binding EF-hand superfamily protein